jgi:hypothetical protein
MITSFYLLLVFHSCHSYIFSSATASSPSAGVAFEFFDMITPSDSVSRIKQSSLESVLAFEGGFETIDEFYKSLSQYAFSLNAMAEVDVEALKYMRGILEVDSGALSSSNSNASSLRKQNPEHETHYLKLVAGALKKSIFLSIVTNSYGASEILLFKLIFNSDFIQVFKVKDGDDDYWWYCSQGTWFRDNPNHIKALASLSWPRLVRPLDSREWFLKFSEPFVPDLPNKIEFIRLMTNFESTESSSVTSSTFQPLILSDGNVLYRKLDPIAGKASLYDPLRKKICFDGFDENKRDGKFLRYSY